MADKAHENDATSPVGPVAGAPAGVAPGMPRRGHRGTDARDAVAEMAARAQEISLEAGSKVAAAMKEIILGAAGLAGFAVESARDLVQYMVRRGQMTPEEGDKLLREAEEGIIKSGRPIHRPAPAPARTAPGTSASAAPAAAPRIATPAAAAAAPAARQPAKSASPATPAAKSVPAAKAPAHKSSGSKAAPTKSAAKKSAAKPAKPAKKSAAKPARGAAKPAAKKGASGKGAAKRR